MTSFSVRPALASPPTTVPKSDGGSREDRLRLARRLRDAPVRGGVGEVTVDVGEAADEAFEDVVVDLLARCGDRVVGALDEMFSRPVVERDADDRAVEKGTLPRAGTETGTS